MVDRTIARAIRLRPKSPMDKYNWIVQAAGLNMPKTVAKIMVENMEKML
jgi:hypothetical protein